MDNRLCVEGEGEIQVQVGELKRLSDTSSVPNTLFEPHGLSGIERRDSVADNPVPPTTTTTEDMAPEKKLTIFALRLAVLEKAATGLGTLGFIWATVVLLGGFAITLDRTDFWPIAAVKKQKRETVEGTLVGPKYRDTTRTRPPTRTWNSSTNVPVVQYAKRFFLSSDISRIFNWLQLLSATACVVLSLTKLIKRNYGEIAKGDTDKRNRGSALNIFYALALAEALLFLLEKAYWEYKFRYCKLIEEVNKECELGPSGIVSTKRFFYDAYSRCVNTNIFDGLKMDMVSFAMDLLASNSADAQVIGARILCQFTLSQRFSDDTLQKIGISIFVVERLVDMLNWTDYNEEELRRNSIPATDEIGEKKVMVDHPNYSFWTFNHLGLLILKNLARDHENCGKIGNTRGLLAKIIDFTYAEERLLKNENVTPSKILTVERSLQLVKMLVSTTGTTGQQLRRGISEIVFTISNIRDILRHGEKHPLLQKLSIETLTSLALEDGATERIGGTGGVLKELFNIFSKNTPIDQEGVTTAAGEALAMLALESQMNCHRILKLKVMERLVVALNDPVLRVNAARILRNLCIYSGFEFFNQLEEVKAAAPTVLQAIMSEKNKLQEVMIGLAANVFTFMNSYESREVFEESGITEFELANKLIRILKKYQYPPTNVPRIRRFVIELAIWMMKDKTENIHTFKDLGMEQVLEGVLDTTSELESFNVFSGIVGLNRHMLTIHTLVENALELLEAM
ncbi:unnamed protein product [Lupinus luteus]|uniref:ARM repeat superfamily protein n=1 Tax=Lupinus luteus TaxID=3873 RepID=A0AAV1WIC2_LUPLU